MTARERLIAPLGFALAGIVFLVAALIPLAKGQPLNATFLPLGLLSLILGLATWRRAGTKSDERPTDKT